VVDEPQSLLPPTPLPTLGYSKVRGMPQEQVVDLAVLEPVARRVFPAARSVTVERASPNRLLVVYRIHADETVCYLRVAEEVGHDLTTDAQLLGRLAGLGVRVPEVVHVESNPSDLDRSFMVVAALDGDSLACHGTDAQARHAASEAGCDAALISTLEVDGFGWLRRDGLPGLRAESAHYADFAVTDLPAPWPGWLAGAFTTPELDNLQAILTEERQRSISKAHLAHGDLDVTHIWLDHHGQYTGIIDFGEARGADPFFDVGHFLARPSSPACASSRSGSARNATTHAPANRRASGSPSCAACSLPGLADRAS
jgi:aminoglycoside phosphotransferase (APT) family kinase protein